MPIYLSKNVDGEVKCGCFVDPCDVGETIEAAISGIVSCGCIPGAGTSFECTSLVIDATAMLTLVSPGLWEATNIGDAIFRSYGTADDCTGPFDETETTIDIHAGCSGGTWNVTIDGSGGAFIFFTGTVADINDPITNERTCDGANTTGEGTVTLSVP